MKVLILSIFLTIVVSFSAHAENKNITICDSIYDISKTIMTARQQGFDITETVKLAKSADPDVNLFLNKIVIQAYKQQKFATETYQQEAAKEFATEYYITCLKYL